MLHRILNIFLLVIVLSLVANTIENIIAQEEEETYPECSPPSRLPATNGAAWQYEATVTVVFNSNDFPENSPQRAAIEAAFINWQDANTNSRVTFTFTTGTSNPETLNSYYIHRQTAANGAATSISNTGTPSTPGNITQRATTAIDPRVTAASALTSFMAHEIGHTFGLNDCFTCATASTIMSPPQRDCSCEVNPCDQEPFNNTYWGCPPLQRPRKCDEEKVNQYAANYPALPTPTPTPTPTPCLGNGEACELDLDCCSFVCGLLTQVCVEDNGNGGGACSGCTEATCPGQCFQGCCTQTPIVIDVLGNGFDLTSVTDGVTFDLNIDGAAEHLAWTSPACDDGWLTLDRNGNGSIDNGSELFGEFTSQPDPVLGERKNGFIALAEYDKSANGGDNDGAISRADAVFSSLRVWQDANHNGISEASELKTLSELGLLTLELDYKLSKKTDEWGNQFRYRAKVRDVRGNQVGRWAWDVFLIAQP